MVHWSSETPKGFMKSLTCSSVALGCLGSFASGCRNRNQRRVRAPSGNSFSVCLLSTRWSALLDSSVLISSLFNTGLRRTKRRSDTWASSLCFPPFLHVSLWTFTNHFLGVLRHAGDRQPTQRVDVRLRLVWWRNIFGDMVRAGHGAGITSLCVGSW